MVLTLESCSLGEACTALGGSPKLLVELRDRLRDWLKLQPHLPQDVPDWKLDNLIIGTKFSLEQAKRKLDMSYTLRRHIPEIFENRDPRRPGFDRLRQMIQAVYLPKLTAEKYAVTILRPIADDYAKFNATDCMKYLFILGEIQAAEVRSLGTIYIMDLAKASIGFIASFTPPMVRKSEVTAEEINAIRIKGIHFLNASGITNGLITMVKSVLKPKIARRINAHLPGSYEEFYKFIPKSMLPKDYGGDEVSMNELSEEWRQKADDWRDWFLEQDKILVDERLRPGPALDSDNLFGISGSFRKLDVD